MTLSAADGLLACPHCGAPLSVADGDATCGRHHFDVARQRYLNLLGGPQPAHADTAAMVAARVRVHERGVFAALADALAASLAGAGRILEVGAGPGAYLVRCLGADPARRGLALDISTAAARVAAQADARVAAVVADVWTRLPVRDQAVDAVLAVFAPRNLPEFARVLAPGGRLVVAVPTPSHLAALRRRHDLLAIPDDKDDHLARQASGLFTPVETLHVSHPINADPTLAADLIAMGPNAFHQHVEVTEPVHDRVDVTVHVWER